MNYQTMTDTEIAEFVEANIGDFGDYDVTAADILAKQPHFERFEHGFAIVNNSGKYNVELWFLYVAPEHRGRRIGHHYVRELQRKHASEYYMSLHCHKRLRPFYGSLGFRVEERNGDNRKMTDAPKN